MINENFVHFLKENGCIERDATLVRKDGTLAAELKDGKWRTHPLQEEMSDFVRYNGRLATLYNGPSI